MPAPIYTPDNCDDPAYQLDWSYSAFWRTRPPDLSWLDELKRLNEPDHIRILQHQFREPDVSQFLISTRPEVAPLLVVQRVKGRLQHLLHGLNDFAGGGCEGTPAITSRDRSGPLLMLSST
jgi:hypothetical protein